MRYIKTKWIDDITRVDAHNLNKLEQAMEEAYLELEALYDEKSNIDHSHPDLATQEWVKLKIAEAVLDAVDIDMSAFASIRYVEGEIQKVREEKTYQETVREIQEKQRQSQEASRKLSENKRIEEEQERNAILEHFKVTELARANSEQSRKDEEIKRVEAEADRGRRFSELESALREEFTITEQDIEDVISYINW